MSDYDLFTMVFSNGDSIGIDAMPQVVWFELHGHRAQTLTPEQARTIGERLIAAADEVEKADG